MNFDTIMKTPENGGNKRRAKAMLWPAELYPLMRIYIAPAGARMRSNPHRSTLLYCKVRVAAASVLGSVAFRLATWTSFHPSSFPLHLKA